MPKNRILFPDLFPGDGLATPPTGQYRPELVQVVASLKRTCNANRSFLVLWQCHGNATASERDGFGVVNFQREMLATQKNATQCCKDGFLRLCLQPHQSDVKQQSAPTTTSVRFVYPPKPLRNERACLTVFEA